MSRLDEYDLEGVIRFSDGRENNNYKERERVSKLVFYSLSAGRERERTLVLKDSRVRYIWNYLTTSPCYWAVQ